MTGKNKHVISFNQGSFTSDIFVQKWLDEISVVNAGTSRCIFKTCLFPF